MDTLTSTFRSCGVMLSRTVSATVRTAVLDVPSPPAALLADWHREVYLQLGLDSGDIEPLPLGRTRLRWPQLRRCFDVVDQWMTALDMPHVLGDAEVALMASRGTRYHHDGAQYGGKAFCNLFLSEESATDLHFPASGRRIALARGTAVLFDPCQPHAIVKRGSPGFDCAEFAPPQMQPQVFLSWELPVEDDLVARALGIRFDTVTLTGRQMQEEQVWLDGAQVRLCPTSGGWLVA